MKYAAIFFLSSLCLIAGSGCAGTADADASGIQAGQGTGQEAFYEGQNKVIRKLGY